MKIKSIAYFIVMFFLRIFYHFFDKFLQEFAESSLHKAISHENGHSLHIVDFIVQNSLTLDKPTREGNTPLHYCVIQNQPESMRLLLRSGANASTENNNGKSPLSIAKERNHQFCEEMVIFQKFVFILFWMKQVMILAIADNFISNSFEFFQHF